MNVNCQGHAIVLCSTCLCHTEHVKDKTANESDTGWVWGWFCEVCGDFTDLELAEVREWAA